MYGTSTGTLGQLFANNTNIEKGWTLEPEKRAGGINCINFCDVTKKGIHFDHFLLFIFSFVIELIAFN